MIFRHPILNGVAHKHAEMHADSFASRSNWLRAAVLGSNDGIVSLAALVVGVAGATDSQSAILIAGVAGLLAGALSMAVGEYVSVSSQRDTEMALLEKERLELVSYPAQELEELVIAYEKKGLSRGTAERVAKELTAKDAFAAHVEAELRIDPEELTNPWHAAFASGISFLVGAILPLIAIMLPSAGLRVPVTFAAVFAALLVTGLWSARMSHAPILKATMRVITGGILAMIITFGIGKLFNVTSV